MRRREEETKRRQPAQAEPHFYCLKPFTFVVIQVSIFLFAPPRHLLCPCVCLLLPRGSTPAAPQASLQKRESPLTAATPLKVGPRAGKNGASTVAFKAGEMIACVLRFFQACALLQYPSHLV
jgi:hypothetical protein